MSAPSLCLMSGFAQPQGVLVGMPRAFGEVTATLPRSDGQTMVPVLQPPTGGGAYKRFPPVFGRGRALASLCHLGMATQSLGVLYLCQQWSLDPPLSARLVHRYP